MEPHAHRLGLAAVATISDKPVNQDACALAFNSDYPLSGVVVADGLGSQYGADLASAVVANSLSAELAVWEPGRPIDFHALFAIARQRLIGEAGRHRQEISPDIDMTKAYGTTAICALETDRTLMLAYLGNGGIFHIRGNFNTFPSSQLLPWSSINHLNPHTISLDGRNAMYKLLSPRTTPEEAEPSVVTISKDEHCFGDIVLCCTDGVYSFDQTAIGRDSRNNLWISGELSMERFYDALKQFFDEEPSSDDLQSTLQTYLNGLNAAGLVTDDCTVGVVISGKALAYQAQLREKRMAGAAA